MHFDRLQCKYYLHHDSDFSLDFCSKILFSTESNSFRNLTIYYLIRWHREEDYEYEFILSQKSICRLWFLWKCFLNNSFSTDLRQWKALDRTCLNWRRVYVRQCVTKSATQARCSSTIEKRVEPPPSQSLFWPQCSYVGRPTSSSRVFKFCGTILISVSAGFNCLPFSVFSATRLRLQSFTLSGGNTVYWYESIVFHN